MRPKTKLKSDSGSPRTSLDNNSNHEAQSNQRMAQKSGAFSYIKSRLFHTASSNGQKHSLDPETSSYEPLIMPASEESSTISASASTQNKLDIPTGSPRNHHSESGTNLSKSFESPALQAWENARGTGNVRPVSVLGLEGVVQQVSTPNSSRRSELADIHARQLSSMTTPIKRINSPPTKQYQGKTKRFSGIVIKEGYLFKKTDFKSFSRSARLDRSWKGYQVVLRGHKLYLYRTQHENALKSYFPSPKDSMPASNSSASFSSRSPSSDVFPYSFPFPDKGMALDLSDFDPESHSVISCICGNATDISNMSTCVEYLYGDCFTETDSKTGEYRGYHFLMIFTKRLVICKRDWSNIKTSTPKSDSVVAHSDPGQLAYKWRLDLDIPLSTVSLVESNENGKNGSQEEKRSNSDDQTDRGEQPKESKDQSNSVTVQGIELDILPPGQKYPAKRLFVPSSSGSGKLWKEQFQSAARNYTRQPDTAPVPVIAVLEAPQDDINHELILRELTEISDIFDYRDIQGGSIRELARELVRKRERYSEDSYQEFLRAFLLTYSIFTTSVEIISILKNQLIATCTDEELGGWTKKRVYTILQVWSDEFRVDVVGEVATGLLDILDLDVWQSGTTSDVTSESIQYLKQHVIDVINENAIKYETAVSMDLESSWYDSSVNTVIKSTASDKDENKTIDVSDILATGFTTNLFLQIDPAEFAKQLYLFHQMSYQAYKSRLLNPLCYIPQTLPGTTTPSHLLFTTSSPHFITNFVNQHILVDSHLVGSEKDQEYMFRALLIEHWIHVGEQLLALGDMCGWCSIAVSICSFAILRLKQSWKFVSPELVERVTFVWAPILHSSNMFSIDIWMDFWKKYPHDRLNVLDATLNGITLPEGYQVRSENITGGLTFFGVIRQFVERVRKHMDKNMNLTNTQHELDVQIVNFEKYWCIYSAVYRTLKRYRDLRRSQQQRIHPHIEPVGPIQALFQHNHINHSSVPHDYNVLQDCSLQCEPKPIMPGLEARAHQKWKVFGEGITPPSNWLLSFPRLFSIITLEDTLPGIFYPNTVRNMKMFQQTPSSKSSRSKRFAMPDTIRENDITEKSDELGESREGGIQEPDRRSRNRKRTYSFPSSRSNSGFGLDSGLSATANMESNSRSWINPDNYKNTPASSKSAFCAISHIGAVGEKLLSVRDGELILQMESDDDELAACASRASMKALYTPLIKLVDASKTGISFTWTENWRQISNDESAIRTQKVLVKAGTIERLLDVLIYGLSEYSANLDSQDEFGEYVFSERRLWVDMEEFVNIFFSMYRIFVSSTELLEHLRKNFRNASSVGRLTKLRRKYSLKSMFDPSLDTNRNMEELDLSDWNYVARVRLQILDLFSFWIDNYFWDFKDDYANRKRISHFLEQTSASLDEMRLQVIELVEEQVDADGGSESIFEAMNILQTKITAIQRLFLMHLLTPPVKLQFVGDPQTSYPYNGKIAELYENLYLRAKDEPNPALVLKSSTNPVHSMIPKRHVQSVMDQLSASDIIQQTDTLVRAAFTSVTIQDWLVLWDVLLAQSLDPNAWLPPRKGTSLPGSNQMMYPPYTEQAGGINTLDEEIIIADIFIAIQSARQFAVPSSHVITESLLKAFPETVQQLIDLHFSIRSWIITELTSSTINAEQRAERIQKCLDMISLSRIRMASEPTIQDFCIDSEKVDEKTGHVKVIPGFVEYSILSALVSPPVRLFVKSWVKISGKNGRASLDTLESIVDASILTFKQSKSADKLTRSRPYVIGLSWIIRIMLQICDNNVQNLRRNSPHVRLEQCRHCYNFIRFIVSIQELVQGDGTMHTSESVNFTEKLRESLAPRMMNFLIYPVTTYPTISWRELREFANRENGTLSKQIGSQTASSRLAGSGTNPSHNIASSPRSIVFTNLIANQQEKSKLDMKERERIDKEWRENQHKLQKRQQEQAKTMEKRERKLLKHQHSASRHHHPSTSHLPWINSFLRGLKLTHTNTENQDTTQTNMDGLPIPIPTENMKASNVINLINSTSSVASTYLKRDSVFRIVTEEGGQYLFQAMNDDDMHDWIRAINGAAKEGAARRLTVLVAEAESKRRSGNSDELNFLDDHHIKKGKDARGSVYGADISELMPSGNIPVVVEKCIEEIERRGLEEVGIYRVAGSGETVSELRQQLNRYAATVNLGDDHWIDINVVADALKQFFRELPEPLLTYERYGDFMKASALEDHDERVLAIKRITKQLPPNNYHLLKRVIEHFVVVTDYEASNHMYATNLAIVFGPTLLRPVPGPISFATTMANIGHQQNIVKNLITHYHFVFDVENEDCEREPVPAEGDGTISQTTSIESQ